MNPRDEYKNDLDRAERWYQDDIKDLKDAERSKQLRYSLCNKLAGDWQRFVKGMADEAGITGVSSEHWGNCWPSQVSAVYASKDRKNPFISIKGDHQRIFKRLIPRRNNIGHGNEPATPSNAEIEKWVTELRRIAQGYDA